MTILLVAHTKGGVSKTTTVINMAVMRAIQGRDVLLVDCDSGQSARAWASVREANGLSPHITCVTLFGETVHRDIQKLATKYDDIIIDAGGEGDGAPEIRRIMTVADKVLTPCRPPMADSARLRTIHEMISDARGINEKLDAMLFPSQASTHPNAGDVIKFYSDAAKYSEYRILETVMRTRTSYQGWLDTGEVVIEQKKADANAIDEMTKLYAEVWND